MWHCLHVEVKRQTLGVDSPLPSCVTLGSTSSSSLEESAFHDQTISLAPNYSFLNFYLILFVENFIQEYYIYIISSSSSPPPTLLMFSLTPQFCDFFFNCYCFTHTCTHTTICWDHLMMLVCVHVFRVEHLGLDNLSGSSSLEKTPSPYLSTWLSVVLHLELQLCESFHSHVDILIGVILMQVLFRKQYCWNFMGTAYMSSLRHYVPSGILVLWHLQSFFPLSSIFPEL